MRCPRSTGSRLGRGADLLAEVSGTRAQSGPRTFGVFYVSVRLLGLARREYWIFAVLLTCAAFMWYGDAFAARLSQPAYLVGIFGWLFIAILGSALSVVRHADRLAVRLGEPYGTLILTLSVTVIEVASITAIMLHGENNPTLTRDTLFAVVMILLNGLVGLSLLVGGLRHHEQHYNLQGANAYLGMILPLIAFSLLLPDFTQTTPGPTLAVGQSAFVAIVAVGLYSTFLALQTGRHRDYFRLEDGDLLDELEEAASTGTLSHVLLLLGYMVPVVYLAEELARPADYVIETMGAPDALGGVAIAILVATPEAIGAVRAALENRVQRSINIFLGSVLSTFGLTIPAMIAISYLSGHPLVLGVEHADEWLLIVTLGVSIVTFASGRANVMQGCVHLILFAAYLLLMFQG
jgi:Ca2+:H+ antiporter